MKKEYYFIEICDVIDQDSQLSFLKEMYPNIFQLYEKRKRLLMYGCSNFSFKQKLDYLNKKIDLYLLQNQLPKYLIFESGDCFCQVKELFTKEELSFPLFFLNSCRLSDRVFFCKCLNQYSPEEILQICEDFPLFCQKKEKKKILSFSKYKSVQ